LANNPAHDNDAWERSILGIDNVPLELAIASAGTRVLAAFLDLVVVSLLMVLVLTGGLVAIAALGVENGAWILALLGLALFAVHWGYFAAFEIATAGLTPGKMAIGLRVTSRQGGRASALSVLVRSFLRPLDYVFGVALMLIDRRSRRLGDLVAGTLVVRQGAEDEGPHLGRVPAGWGAREVAVVEGFLRRSEQLEPARAAALASQLVTWVESVAPELAVGLEGEPRPLVRLRLLLAVEGG